VADVRIDHSSEAIQNVRHFKVKMLNISSETRYRQAVLILRDLLYLTWEIRSETFRFAVLHFGLMVLTLGGQELSLVCNLRPKHPASNCQ
jgi:hypothetical protein